MNKIFSIIMCDAFVKGTEIYLKFLMKEYLELLQSLFPGSIKPKHHHMVHYATVMRNMGPLWKISSMRFESRNKEGKVTSNSAISRINVCRTTAIKHQLKLAYQFMTDNFNDPLWYMKVFLLQNWCAWTDNYHEFSHVFSNHYLPDCTAKVLKWVTWKFFKI